VYKAFLQAYIQRGLHRHVNTYSHIEKSLCRVFLQASVEKCVSREYKEACVREFLHTCIEKCVCGGVEKSVWWHSVDLERKSSVREFMQGLNTKWS
jgi:hypothetical protein